MQYKLLYVTNGDRPACKSHKDIPIEHLFGNTNWESTQTTDDAISFTCLFCGEKRFYKQIPEKTLL